MSHAPFKPSLLQFFRDLERNNNREWFHANKARYETDAQTPLLHFIDAMAPRLERISQFLVADSSKVGGSLFRIYRDTRFSKDKSPYKTHAGIHFRHEMAADDVHAPGLYLHVAPTEVFAGIGIWHPDSQTQQKIRAAMAAKPKEWVAARDNKLFKRYYRLDGEKLLRPPKGYAADHPLIEDLKFKDFTGIHEFTRREFLSENFIDTVADCFSASKPFMKFLCSALNLPF